jgi:DNA-directed RNA polymerase beta' subunit
MQELKLTIPRGKIVGIQFSAMSQEHLEHLVNIQLKDSQLEQFAELEDKHLGVVFQEDGQCQTCAGTAAVRAGEMPCPGHMGSIRLGERQQIFHPMLMDKLVFILNLFCPTCRRLKYRGYLEKQHVMDHEMQNSYVRRLRELSPMYKFIQRLQEQCKDVSCCDTKCSYRAMEDVNKLQRTSRSGTEAQCSEDVSPKDALYILNKISAEDLELLGLS